MVTVTGNGLSGKMPGIASGPTGNVGSPNMGGVSSPPEVDFTSGANSTNSSLEASGITTAKKTPPRVPGVKHSSVIPKMKSIVDYFTGAPTKRQVTELQRALRDDIVPRVNKYTEEKDLIRLQTDLHRIHHKPKPTSHPTHKDIYETKLTALRGEKALNDSYLRAAERDKMLATNKLEALQNKIEAVEGRQVAAVGLPALLGAGFALKEGSDSSKPGNSPFDSVMRKKFASLLAADSPLMEPEGAFAAGLGGYGGYLASGLTTPLSDWAADVKANSLIARADALGDRKNPAVRREVAELFRSHGLDAPKTKLMSSELRTPLHDQKNLLKSALGRRYGKAAAIVSALLGSGLAMGMYSQNKMDRAMRTLQAQQPPMMLRG